MKELDWLQGELEKKYELETQRIARRRNCERRQGIEQDLEEDRERMGT